MSWEKEVLTGLHSNLTPLEFEKLIYALLDEMGFTDLVLSGKSGDGGIDLTGVWAPPQDFAPGLRINLDFIIQAKRTAPDKSINPIHLRALKGSMNTGQWGLLITTGKVSPKTREEGLKDPGRIVSTIGGKDLVSLCAKYNIGVKTQYNFDKSFLEPKTVELEPVELTHDRPDDLSEILGEGIGEQFQRIGRTTIYRSKSKVVNARWSQRYHRKGETFWYVLTSGDLDSIEKQGLTHFAYVCANSGIALFTVQKMLEFVQSEKLGRSPKEGPLRHYHIQFDDSEGKLEILLKGGNRENIQDFFHPLKKPDSILRTLLNHTMGKL